MAKIKDEAPVKSAKAAVKGTAVRRGGSRLAPFFTNLVRTDVVKPTQGKNARLFTGVGLGVVVAAGLYQLYELYLKDQYPPLTRFSIPVGLGLAFAWVIWRIVQYPPFADFLIATEAEMNKVSWTSREDLYRATIVVLATVFVLALYLFGVDYLWSWLLQIVGVLKFSGESLGNQ
ncbi:MAG: preprotein translocase, SecE subunit [Planctomycetota bacterium]|nr:preprotein translocase, SecE subunit [Planctomycetota bacterium]